MKSQGTDVRRAGPILLAVLLTGCAQSSPESTTYHDGAREIIEQKCATCHYDGANAPFALTSYEEVNSVKAAVEASIVNGTMPPWRPDNDCNAYLQDRSLSAADKATLTGWLADGAPEGAPQEVAPEPPAATTDFEVHLTLGMEEPYLPDDSGPDDYHCFILPWDAEEPTYVTGYGVEPGRLDLVHHVLLFQISPSAVESFQGMDANSEGPGYTCFGGPQADDEPTLAAGVSLIGGWAPGGGETRLPEGTGLLVEPGSVLVLQMHYNTISNAPSPDQTTVNLQLAANVERPAISQLLAHPMWLLHGGMPIPAGESSVVHSTEIDLSSYMGQIGAGIGVAPGEPFRIHRVALHMHELGRSARLSILRGEDAAEESCLLHIPDWDFGWQGQYELREPVIFQPEDRLLLNCEWDNSPANQPLIDGAPLDPIDVYWGSGTRDEMCLAVVYMTAP